jgi:essential nuclear protein 1
MPKVMRQKGNATKKLKHDPLAKQILDSIQVTDKRKKNKKFNDEDEEDEFEDYLDTKMSSRILKNAKEQYIEEEEEEEEHEDENNAMDADKGKKLTIHDLKFKEEEEDDDNDNHIQADVQGYDESDNQTLSATDAQTLDMFFNSTSLTSHNDGTQKKSFNLQEIILEKIREKEAKQLKASLSRNEQDIQDKLHPKVVSTYKKLGLILSRYTSGPLPKAFKVIPSLANWEEIVFLTNPEKWSNQALYQATRIFISNLDPKMGARFLNMILLPKFRDALQRPHTQDHKRKLNHHIYQSLMKACFRAAAFFKGIVLPLCESGDCTGSEANMIGSVLKKASLPNLHSCAALFKLCQMEYSPTNLFFIKVLLSKRYTLPSQVVAVLVDYFHQFITNPRLQKEQLHVMWHQTLLLFVQLYKKDFSSQQKSKIYNVCKKRSHNLITPEIRKELNKTTNTHTSDSLPKTKDSEMTDE